MTDGAALTILAAVYSIQIPRFVIWTVAITAFVVLAGTIVFVAILVGRRNR